MVLSIGKHYRYKEASTSIQEKKHEKSEEQSQMLKNKPKTKKYKTKEDKKNIDNIKKSKESKKEKVKEDKKNIDKIKKTENVNNDKDHEKTEEHSHALQNKVKGKKDKTKEDKKNINDIKKKANVKKYKDNEKSKKDKLKEDEKNIFDRKKKQMVKKDKESKPKKYKKIKDSSEDILESSEYLEILEISEISDEMSWEKVIGIFNMKNPDTKSVLIAWDATLKLSKGFSKEKGELEKQSKKLWSTQQQARSTQEKLTMRLNDVKSEWKKEATDETWKNYKKIKKDMKIVEKIVDETLKSFFKLRNTIVEKGKEYNQRVWKINTSVARLQERENKDLSMAKKRINHEGKILQQAAKLRGDHIVMMNKAVKAAEDAKQKFIKREDMVAYAEEEYDKEVKKVSCGKKKLEELNKFNLLYEFKKFGLNPDTCRVDTDSKVDRDIEEE